MDFLLTILAFLALAFSFKAWPKKHPKKLPPGPTGLPVLGCLHLLGKLPHQNLHKLSQKYGPIMSMRLGSALAIIVSSPEAAEAFLKTHDHNFASRPSVEAGKHLLYNQQNLSFAPNGSYWRDMRKMCVFELLNSVKTASSVPIRAEELSLLVESIKEASKRRSTVDVSSKISGVTANMSCRMVYGKKYSNEGSDERGFTAAEKELMHLMAVPNFGDYIPAVAGLDLQGLTKKMKATSKILDAFFEEVIDEHVRNKDEKRVKDFVDIMLGFVGSEKSEYRIERDNIKAIMMDMLIASMDTSSVTAEWALTELVTHPPIMSKLQKELEEKIGLDKMVEESELDGLEYLDMVINETFRLHPPAPLLLPHKAMQDSVVNGYCIPKDSRIFINTWAMGKDSRVWEDPAEFNPERFTGSDVNIRGRDFRLLPFGSGRRSCPGMQLGIAQVKLIAAQLVHCFDWELPNGILPSKFDKSEKFGLVTHQAHHLLVIPTYRLRV